MKYLVETLGDYGLQDLFGRQQVHAHRPTVVIPSAFIEGQKGRKLSVLEVLDEAADDAGLAVARTASELKAAIAALPRHGVSKEQADPVPSPAAKPAPRVAPRGKK